MGHFIDGLKSHSLKKFFTCFLYIRKAFFGFLIALGHDMTYFQVFLISSSNLILAILIIKYKPYEKTADNIINSGSEILLICGQVLVASFKEESDDEENRIDWGWLVVGIYGFVMVVHFFYFLWNLIISPIIGCVIKCAETEKEKEAHKKT